MDKKIIMITMILITIVLFSGCDNKEKTIVCEKKIEEVNYTITIKKKDDKVIVNTEKAEFKCLDEEICDYSVESDEEESDKSFDEVVDSYRKDGYSCE